MFSSIVNLIFFVVLGSCLTTTGTALRIEIRPGQYTEESSGPINVSCVLDRKDADVYDVFMMQVIKDDDPPLLTIRAAKPSLGRHVNDTAKYETEGLISSDASKSYLRLSILSPSESDNGRYTCKVLYSDLEGYSKEKRAGGNVNVDRIDLNDVVRQLMDQVSALNTKVTYETIAFTATRSGGDLSGGDTVVFPDVVMNLGQCYDKDTGIFTTPRAGLYTFHLSLMTQCKGCQMRASLTVNDKILSRLWAYDQTSLDQSSKTFIAELEKGDTVKVVAYGTSSLNSNRWNVFSGYLVKPR